MPAMVFKDLRQFTAATADSAAPTVDSTWVTLTQFARNGTVEVRYGAGSMTGTPTSANVSLWRKVVDGVTGAVAIDRLLTKTILLADANKSLPDVIDAYGATFFVSLDSFSGGTSPTLTLTVQGRFVEASS